MKKFTSFFILFFILLLFPNRNILSQNVSLHKLFDIYYEERLQLFPLEATANGDNRYNDILPNTGSAKYINDTKIFYDKYLTELKAFNRKDLSIQDRTSYDLLEYLLKIAREGISYHPEYIPATQFGSLALSMGVWGAGNNVQPFKTVKDYENWLKRIAGFNNWVDTAISNFNKGVKSNFVLPRAMVVKMIPQMEKLAEADSSKSIFYGPVRTFPSNFSLEEKEKLKVEYHHSIQTQLIPGYLKLAAYLKNHYLSASRTTSGYNALPNGENIYKYYVRFFTTTNKTPDEIYRTGLKMVAEIHNEMEKIKVETGFKGTLQEFYNYLNTDPKFLPFKNADEILASFRLILQTITPNIDKLFSIRPRTLFEIRQTEAFRAASSAAQYNAGTPDGKRPGIFYVPIVNAQKYPSFSMEDLFLHEAIPGHHYQVSLQKKNTSLPLFRRNSGQSSFSEGWGLYAETLGKPLGVYTDPYQYMGFLQGQIHRAVRYVVDVGLHTGKMTREEAIKYMLDNMPITEQFATSEIERYMAIPGQALSYMTGRLKIEELRDRYIQQLGRKFDLKYFHDAVLNGGSLPLTIFESYMDDWAKTQMKKLK